MEKNNSKVPVKFYLFSLLVVLALVLVTFIPSSMVYRLRLFDAIGLPDWVAEIIRLVIVVATPFAVLSTGLMRIFAVSDSEHASAMLWAALLEGLACVLEIVAAMVNGHDFWALVGQAVTLGGSIAAVFGALVYTLTANGFYHLAVANNQRTLMFNRRFQELLEQALISEEGRAQMQAAAHSLINDASEKMAGRKLDIPTTQHKNTGQGNDGAGRDAAKGQGAWEQIGANVSKMLGADGNGHPKA